MIAFSIPRGLASRFGVAAPCALLLLAGSAAGWPRQSNAPSQQLRDRIVERARHRIEKTDIRISGRLSRVDGNGARANFHYTMKAHWFPDGLYLLFEIADPASARQRIFIRMNPQGELSIARAAAADASLKPLAADRFGEGIAGTLLTYEDLAENQFFWTHQALLPDTFYGARHCHLLESEPSAALHSQYASARSWIDFATGVPVLVEKTLRSLGVKKQFVSFGLRRNGSVWSPSQIEITQPGSSSTTVLVIERGSAQAKLTRKDFEVRP